MNYNDVTAMLSSNALINALRLIGHNTTVSSTFGEQAIDVVNLSKNVFIRIAGISGAVAVAMGAYGTHVFFKKKDVPDELKEVYKTANEYHFFHTLALLGVPNTRRPLLVGTVILAGMTLFCGTCHYYALTGDGSLRRFTPYGGSLLIIAWLTMVV